MGRYNLGDVSGTNVNLNSVAALIATAATYRGVALCSYGNTASGGAVGKGTAYRLKLNRAQILSRINRLGQGEHAGVIKKLLLNGGVVVFASYAVKGYGRTAQGCRNGGAVSRRNRYRNNRAAAKLLVGSGSNPLNYNRFIGYVKCACFAFMLKNKGVFAVFKGFVKRKIAPCRAFNLFTVHFKRIIGVRGSRKG